MKKFGSNKLIQKIKAPSKTRQLNTKMQPQLMLQSQQPK
jgi:hypothetical protein